MVHSVGPLWPRLCVELQKHEEQQWILGYQFCGKWLNVFLEGPGLWRGFQVCPLMRYTDSQGGSAGLDDVIQVPGGGHS